MCFGCPAGSALLSMGTAESRVSWYCLRVLVDHLFAGTVCVVYVHINRLPIGPYLTRPGKGLLMMSGNRFVFGEKNKKKIVSGNLRADVYMWCCSEPGPGDAGFLRREREPGAVPDPGAGAEQWRRRQQRQQVDGHRVHVLPHRRLPQRLLLGTLQDLRHLPGHLCPRKSHTSTYLLIDLPIFPSICQSTDQQRVSERVFTYVGIDEDTALHTDSPMFLLLSVSKLLVQESLVPVMYTCKQRHVLCT
jgi:hypothetical protein